MVLDGLRGYLQLATGLTEVTRERAMAAAKSLAAQGEAGVEAVIPDAVRTQVGSLADDLMASSRANRDNLLNLVRTEVERSVARLGLVSSADLDTAEDRAKALGRRVEELEQQLAGRGSRARTVTKKSGAKRSSATRSAKTSTAKSTAKKSTAKKSTAKKSTAKRSTAKRSTAKRSTAKRSTAKRSTAKKSS